MNILAKDYIQQESSVQVVSASEAKSKLGSLIKLVASNQQDIVIENHGEPSVVMVSFSEYTAGQQLKEEARRRHALQQLRAVRNSVQARLASEGQPELAEEEALQIGDKMTRVAIDGLVAKGKVHFEQDKT